MRLNLNLNTLQAALEKADYNYNEAYYWCPCSFEEYEEYYGFAYQYSDEEGHAWCPCYSYDEYNGYELSSSSSFQYQYHGTQSFPGNRQMG